MGREGDQHHRDAVPRRRRPVQRPEGQGLGAKGVPAELEAKAGDHKVQTTSLVTTYEELEDALANGYPVAVCSDQGFTITRDAGRLLLAAAEAGRIAC